MTKKEARAHCRREWLSFLKGDSARLILEQLSFFFRQLKAGTRLLISIPLKDELDYQSLLSDKELELYAPRTLENEIEFRYYEIGHPEFSQLEAGYNGIPGPGAHAPLLKEPLRKEDQVILPCLGLGKGGIRLGRGGGYYDRWREKLSVSRSICLAPESLLSLDFAAEEHDIRVQYALTEKGIHDYRKP